MFVIKYFDTNKYYHWMLGEVEVCFAEKFKDCESAKEKLNSLDNGRTMGVCKLNVQYMIPA